jgi:hypothetical protein
MKKILLACIFLAGCARGNNTIIETEFCTVSKVASDAVISCPDGTELILPPNIIREEIITEVPITIFVPKKCGKEHDKDKGD